MPMRFLLAFVWSAAALPSLSQTVEPLVHEGVVAAPIDVVWNARTTSKGLQSWLAPHADIDLSIGGKMRANHNPQGTWTDGEVIENSILAFEPLRMLSISVSKAPEDFPFSDTIYDMWTVIYLEPLGQSETRVRVASMGFTLSEQSQPMREFFDRGNALTIRQLQERVGAAKKP